MGKSFTYDGFSYVCKYVCMMISIYLIARNQAYVCMYVDMHINGTFVNMFASHNILIPTRVSVFSKYQ